MVWAPDAPAVCPDLASPIQRPTAATMAPLTRFEVLRRLDTGLRGLVEAHAEERLLRHGENTIPTALPVSWPRRLVRSVRDPFTLVLLCLGLVSAAIASWGTAGVIVVLVAISCVLRSSGEYRADRSTAALRRLLPTTATVQRRVHVGGMPVSREIPVEQLVPGDVIKLGPGDLVPADVRLLRCSGLTVHQAALTGESGPVAKHASDAPTPGGDLLALPHLCFQGTSVVSGSALAVVVATGADTRLAGAGRPVGRRAASAFDRSVNGISWSLVRFMVLIPPLALIVNVVLRGRGLEALPFAVAVAVGLTPEMLPVVVTAALARGSAALARGREVIVKRLPALHDLGAMTVLCTDKTGTLTQDRPIVDCAIGPDGRRDEQVLRWAAVNSLWTLQLADLPSPDALDEAILQATQEFEGFEGVAALPFDPVRRISSAVVHHPGSADSQTLVVKGAVESVLQRCTRARTAGTDHRLDAATLDRLHHLAEKKAGEGRRLIAVAIARRPGRIGPYGPEDEQDLIFLGFVALRDAPVPGAADALAVLARRGVTVKVLTGDHPATAGQVCRDLGIDPGAVVVCDEIDGLDDAALRELAGRTTVFARCSPDHKARIVQALREAGHNTGFLGDGVNDLPALRAADVGICPRDAVDVSREAADVVLAAKDLAAIGHAILVGRHSTGNIVTYLRVVLSSNLGNVIAMLGAGLFLPFLPMLPMQVLVQNLCFDAAQLAFVFDRPDPAALRRPSRLMPRGLFRFVVGFASLNAMADLATFAVLASVVSGSTEPGGQAFFHSGWFVENLLTQALMMLLLRRRRAVSVPLFVAIGALACIGILLPLSPAAAFLGLATLPATFYMVLAVVVVLYGGALASLTLARRASTAERLPAVVGDDA
ncbi:magnesium-translocating P-type ATPase [Sphaerisporangium sp. NPDC051011]|uniref:magnesium-translocating P-type ATPase n=1 Tax=Sphaerisporangium sp. NPDC051011 TaxID=3155792 RepID=UPI003407C754